MNCLFHPDAERELVEAVDYYESCSEGLGLEFLVEICSVIERIVTHPKAWPILQDNVRRAQTSRFPYGVVYAETAESLYVLAIMHLHRRPDYWSTRTV